MDSPAEQNAFTTTFACLTIILLTFFLYLNSLAEVHPKKQRQALTSVNRTFQRPPHEGGSDPRHLPPGEIQRTVAGAALVEMWGKLPDSVKGGSSDLAVRDNAIVITLSTDWIFVPGDDQLRAEALPLLSRLAEKIASGSFRITIEAHSDNVSRLTVRYPSRWALTLQQAQSIYRLLIDAGVAPETVSALGYAEFRPKFSNDTTDGQNKNRRLVIRLQTEASNDAL